MQELNTPNSGENARVSRRKFLGYMAATSTAVPAVALAGQSIKTHRLQQSLETQLAECIEQLQHILGQMHPEVNDLRWEYAPLKGGRSYMCWLAGHARKGGAS